MASVNENLLLSSAGIRSAERYQIEGLREGRGGGTVSTAQLSMRAVARVCYDPSPEVGKMQRRTTTTLLRPFPLGCGPLARVASAAPAMICMRVFNAVLAQA